MRRSGRKKSPGIRYIILIWMILLFLSIFMLLALLIISKQSIFNSSMKAMNPEEYVFRHIDTLKNGDYDKLNFGDSLGKNGYYEILNSDGRALYSSRADKMRSYSKEILNYISDIEEDTYSEVIPFSQNGKKGYVYVQKKLDENSTPDDLKGIAIISSDREIIYSSLDIGTRKITNSDLKVMLETTDDSAVAKTFLQKYEFVTNGGNRRYLILHTSTTDRRSGNIGIRIDILTDIAFAAAVIFIVMSFAIGLAKKIKRPIDLLNGALKSIAAGKREAISDFHGSREFEEAVDTYNNMEQKLLESEEKNKKAEEEKRRMIADISHDLKTPVTVIQGYLDAMKDGLIPEDQWKKYIDIMIDKTDRLSELIFSFTDYSRLDHPEFRYDCARVNLTEYLRGYMAEKYDELTLAGYIVDTDIPENSIFSMIDRKQMERVFDNILSNIRKYTEAGTVISVSLSDKGKKAVILFGDNGPGMPEELKQNAFLPFVTGDDARRGDRGTGLGLSITRSIVEGHHGTIRILAKNECKKGTVFRIELPEVD